MRISRSHRFSNVRVGAGMISLLSVEVSRVQREDSDPLTETAAGDLIVISALTTCCSTCSHDGLILEQVQLRLAHERVRLVPETVYPGDESLKVGGIEITLVSLALAHYGQQIIRQAFGLVTEVEEMFGEK